MDFQLTQRGRHNENDKYFKIYILMYMFELQIILTQYSNKVAFLSPIQIFIRHFFDHCALQTTKFCSLVQSKLKTRGNQTHP